MLSPAKRARITAHLADCESCYEIFSGAVHFQRDESLSDQAEAKEGRVVHFPSRKEGEARSRRPSWLGIAAAAVLLVGVGFTGYKLLFPAEPKINVADLKSKISTQDLYSYATYRGGAGHLDSDEPPQFMVGVLLTDISLTRGPETIDANRLDEIGRTLKKVSFVDTEEAQTFQDKAKKLQIGDLATRQEIAQSWPALEARIEENLSPSVVYRLGKWSEAGRLAARTRTPAFFSRWSNRRFFTDLLKDPLSSEDGIDEPIKAIKAITDRGDFRDEDYAALEKGFSQIIRHYDI